MIRPYINLLKYGLTSAGNLEKYIASACVKSRRDKGRRGMVSSIPRNQRIYFNRRDPVTNNWMRYGASLTQDLKYFHLYRFFMGDKKKIGMAHVYDVLPPEILKKYKLDSKPQSGKDSVSSQKSTKKTAKKPVKSTTRKSKPSTKRSSSSKRRKHYTKRSKR